MTCCFETNITDSAIGCRSHDPAEAAVAVGDAPATLPAAVVVCLPSQGAAGGSACSCPFAAAVVDSAACLRKNEHAYIEPP